MIFKPAQKFIRLLMGIVAAVPLLLSAGQAHADSDPVSGGRLRYWFESGAFAGGHFFDDEHGLGRFYGDPTGFSPNHSGEFGARLSIHTNPWLAFEAEASVMPTLSRDKVTAITVFGFRGSVVLNLRSEGLIRPFVLAGYGTLTSFVEDTTAIPNDTDGMFHAGVGTKIQITDRFGLRIDARIMTPTAFASSILKVGDETHYGGPDYQLLAGPYVKFGEGPRIKEVIIKEEIKVVTLPPVDPDNDGIVGASDKCPEIAEDKDGFEDEDGCPETDNDNDGIHDVSDKCPLDAETKNGIDDEDGCPELDTDSDGFLGSQDQCPAEPETKNNYKDSDGCPDEVPAAVKQFTGVIEGIKFKTRSAAILKGSNAILDKAVKVLSENPEVRLEISGHTDSKGKADFNRDLSQKRADAVKDYFVKKGISAGRLTTVGYGMDRPIADNKKEAGRSKNRRTEFALVSDSAK